MQDLSKQLENIEATLNAQDTEWASIQETVDRLGDAALDVSKDWMDEFYEATDTRGLTRSAIPAGAMRA